MLGTLVGQYRIVEQVGRGSAGTVYKALDESLNRAVAIKIVNPDLAGTESIRRFRTEATALARLNHPAVTAIYELFRANAELLMVMEFVRGDTLERLSQRLGPLPFDRAAFVVDQVLGGIGHAHGASVVHRDIKPANVMLTAAGAIKIMDFGVARVGGMEHVAGDGYMMGTPAYMAPEQVLGAAVDGRADLYSIGIILYRLLTGTLPFTGKTPLEVLQKQMTEAPVPLERHRADLPDWCDTIVQRALAKSPDRRFQTAAEFRSLLAELAGIGPGSDTPGALVLSKEEMPDAASSRALPPADTWVRTFASVLPSPDDGGTSAPAAAPAPASAPSSPGETLVLKRRPLPAFGPMLATAAIVTAIVYAALGRPAAVPITARKQHDAAAGPAAAPVTPRSGQPTVPASAVHETVQQTMQPSTQLSPKQSVIPPPARQPSVEPAATPLPARRPTQRAAETPGASQQTTRAPRSPQPSPPPAEPSGQPSAQPPAQAAPAASAARTSSPPASESGKRESETAPPVTFEAKALVARGDGHKEYDAQLVLTDRELQVVTRDGDSTTRVVHALPYGTVMSIAYSRGRDPVWLSPDGPAIVARTGGRAFGLFRRDRQWLTLQTSTTPRFVVVRISESTARQILAALESRTGRRAQDLSERTPDKEQ
jgi:serine/threonine-protein kinase